MSLVDGIPTAECTDGKVHVWRHNNKHATQARCSSVGHTCNAQKLHSCESTADARMARHTWRKTTYTAKPNCTRYLIYGKARLI